MNIQKIAIAGICLFGMMAWHPASAQVKIKKSTTWELSGRVQLQHRLDPDTESDASQTNNGFRIRRGRFQAKAMVSDRIQAKFQIEVRDNSPRLKDAEGKLKLANGYTVRFGQFKVPVWREELRSSGSLLLVERSAAAEMLVDLGLSARHIGLEISKKLGTGGFVAVNYSNGAGEGGREDGRSKSDFVNNGKLYTGRIDLPLSDHLKIGVSGALNQVGNKIAGRQDNTGNILALAPDFGVYLDAGNNAKLDIEGGAVIASVAKEFTGAAENSDVTLFDLTGRWHKRMAAPNADLAGLDGFELAAGFTLVDENDMQTTYFRFGPGFTFGKQTRLQMNVEIASPENGDSTTRIRSQATFNF